MVKKAVPKKPASQSKTVAAKKATEPGFKFVKKEAPGRGQVDILAETYDAGIPSGEDEGRWRQKIESREEKIKYLQNGERYWYSDDWFGSEKRKTPA
jgi:hypothetical protein